MAILFMDGFEIDFANGNHGLWDNVKYDSVRGTLAYVSSPIRTGQGSLHIDRDASGLSDSNYLIKRLPSFPSEVYCGFGFRPANDGSTEFRILEFLSSNDSSQFYITYQVSTTQLRFWQGNGTLLGTQSSTFSANTWYYVEFRLVVDDAAGILTVRIDQSEEIALTSIDTNNSGGDIGVIRLGSISPDNAGNGDFYFDDFCLMDTTGNAGNTWPNGAGIYPLFPDGNGNYSAWTSTGVDDYTEIDDWSTFGGLNDGTTTMLSHSTSTGRFSVTIDNSGVTGTVHGIMLVSALNQAYAGSATVEHFLRISSTDYDETAFRPHTDFEHHVDIISENPATSTAFTVSELDALEIGMEIT